MALNRNIDITPDQRETVISLLSEHLPNTVAWVYGSRIRKISRPASDLDMVVFASPQQARAVSELRESFEESNLPFRVDLFIWDKVPESFRKQIEGEHVVLLAGDANHAEARPDLPTDPIISCSQNVQEAGLLFGDCASLVSESVDPANLALPVPYVGLEHIVQERLHLNGTGTSADVISTKRRFEKGNILFGKLRPYFRKVVQPDFRGICSSDIWVIEPKNDIDSKFLFYWCASWGFVDFLDASSQGTRMPRAKWEMAVKHCIPAFSVQEQAAIGRILGTLDDKIELNRRMNETLEAMARAIFKDWFVDFGPTRAKAEGRAPYLAPGIWNLFPNALDDEDKPVGWSFDTLARLAGTNSDSWTARHHPPTVEYVDLSSAKWGNIEATTLLDWEAAPSRARRIAKAGDTIVGTTRPGNGSFAYISRDGLTVSTGFAVLSPRSAMYRDAVYIAATSVENIERLANLADGHGGAYPAVKPNEVTDTVIVFPRDEVLASFADLVSPVREMIERAKAESQTLAQTRDLLLPKLMSGEVRLTEVEKKLEAVA